jgi:RNA polymerase sigma factor (sigma-70 family)
MVIEEESGERHGMDSEEHQALLARLRPMASRTLPQCLRGCYAPDDLIQGALEKAIRAFQRKTPAGIIFFKLPEEEILRYLRSAIVSVAADLVRHLDRAKGPGRTPRMSDEEPLADHTSPTGRARADEALERLTEALAALPEDQYQAINLHFLQGLPHAEVALMMGKTRPSVAGLVRRALDALRGRIGDFDLL